jgi:hypothetical protein
LALNKKKVFLVSSPWMNKKKKRTLSMFVSWREKEMKGRQVRKI